MASLRTILVTGATGKQGGAVIEALLNERAQRDFRIVAVTRSEQSKGAQALVAKGGVSIVEGDLDNPSAIFEKTGPVWGVFSVQIAVPGTDSEERQGKALIDAAISSGVGHFVYTSGDRGGPVLSPENPTVVANLIAKHNIEKHLEKNAPLSPQGMTYAILRPVTFLENLSTDRHGLGFARMWEQIGAKRLQLVSTRDIGWFAAQALLRPEEYHNRALSLAGDELSQPEAAVIFKEVVGKDMPIAPCLVGSVVKLVMKEAVGMMFQWLKEVGYGANIQECRRIHPGMQDFRSWLTESSGFVKK
jgi:uncharacterized protein YbjT (DUF2867 family)